ncbi:hypothetical protein LCGC14_0284640, partial [marine sediment metagenome]
PHLVRRAVAGGPTVVMEIGAPADVEQLLCQMVDRLDQMIALLGRETQPQLSVFTRPLRTTNFRVFQAAVGTSPTKIIEADAQRTSFAIIIPTASSIRVAPRSFDPSAVPAISGADLAVFGLDGHVGPGQQAVDAILADPPGDELGVLAAKIKNDDCFGLSGGFCHGLSGRW